ncbi:MAG: hypothetical protein IJR45_06665 [Firmicutes bacterium]|nr:hypothetical protein [Bacillota bacterium]
MSTYTYALAGVKLEFYGFSEEEVNNLTAADVQAKLGQPYYRNSSSAGPEIPIK